MTNTEKLREEWHVRTFNMANEISDYSKVEMLIADWWLDKLHQAVAEERARVRAIINKLPTVNVKTYEEYGGIEIRGINHAEQLIPKYDLLTSLDKPLTDKE